MADEAIIFLCITLGVLIRFALPYLLKILEDPDFSWGNIRNGLRYLITSGIVEILGLVLFLFTDFIENLSGLPTDVDIWVYLFAFGFGIGGNELLNHIQTWLVRFGVLPPAVP